VFLTAWPRGWLLVLLVFALVACSDTRQDSTQGQPSVSQVAVAPGQVPGIAGSMLWSGGRAASDGEAVIGQVLVWASSAEQASTVPTNGMFARPLAAVSTIDGAFEVDLEPGWYLVRGTALGGQVCGELTVEVTPGHITNVGFSCVRR
jgi:hypothetical protein